MTDTVRAFTASLVGITLAGFGAGYVLAKLVILLVESASRIVRMGS